MTRTIRAPSRRRYRGPAMAAALSAIGCQAPRAGGGISDDATARAPPAEPTCGTLRDARPTPMAELGRRGAPIRLGAIGDPRGATPETLAAVRRFARTFGERGVDAVLALGGLGDDRDEIAAVAGALTGAGRPVLALPGDREPEGAFHDGLERARHAARAAAGAPIIVDLQRTRLIDGGGLAVVALPGYPFRSYLIERGGDGTCRYRTEDLPALAAAARALARPDRPTLLVAYTPPRSDDGAAIDEGFGTRLGDPAIGALIRDGGIRFGVFAHVAESGGRAVDRIGGSAAPVPAGAWSEGLYVNVGAADAQGGATALPIAALIELDGPRARYEVLR